MSSATRVISRLLACWLLTTALGCATLQLPLFPKQARKATARNPVAQIVSLWEPAEGRDPKGLPCRGFAGQILFLASRGVLPVSVDGEVRIYLFDNQGTIEEQAEPIHTINFDSGSWAQHFTYGPVGPSYSVFVPYTRRGDYTDPTCSLRVRLTPKKGPVVFSDVANIQLMSFGKTKDKSKSDSDPRVEQTIPMDFTANSNLRKTTTIQLTPEREPSKAPPELLPVGNAGDRVQLAGYQAEAGGHTSSDDRLAQLEQMVKELRSQQVHASKLRSVQPDTPAPPERLVESSDDPMRIRVHPAESSPSESTAVSEDSSAHHSLAPSIKSSPAASERRRHPLEEETATRTSRAKPHPLSEMDDAQDRSTGSAPNSASRRHPLQDDFDDEPRRATPPSKVIRASEPLPAGKRDPFEPIDVEAINSTQR